MAKKDKTPALWAGRVWGAIRRGVPEGAIEVVGNTRVLRVSNWRPRITWQEDGVIKHDRLHLRRVLLSPRWIAVPSWYPSDELSQCSEEKLLQEGVILTARGYKLLIYQQVGGLFKLYRQMQHVEARSDTNQQEVWESFDQFDWKTELGATTDALLRHAIQARIGQQVTIHETVAERKHEIGQLIQSVIKKRIHIRGAVQKLIDDFPHDFVTQGRCLGMSTSLQRHYGDVQTMIGRDQPFANAAKWACIHLGRAVTFLETGKPYDSVHHLHKVVEHLKTPENERDELIKMDLVWNGY